MPRISPSLLLAGALALAPAAVHAQKTDRVVIVNGDVITGEVKGLTRGKLDYNTDDAGRLSIKWEKVIGLTSTHFFEVETASGTKHYGQLQSPQNDGTVIVESAGNGADTLRISDVVEINPLDAGFFQRTKAYLDAGFTFAKANKATTFTLSGQLDYHGPKLGTMLSFDSYAQGQENTASTSRNTVALRGTRFLPNRWSAGVLTQAEQNDELNLDLRFTAGAAAGRVLHQSNRSELRAGAGLVVTTERFTSTPDGGAAADTNKVNLEGLLTAAWDAFRFDSPKLDLATSLTLFPSLSSLGRVRGEWSVRLKYELFKDFNVGINLTDTFDSRPPDATASKNDFITSLTVGWSYRR